MRIYLPAICSNYDGFAKLGSLAAQTKGCVFEGIEIDMQRATWIDANMCAPLGAVLYEDQNASRIERVRKILAANQPHPHPDPPLEGEGKIVDVPRLEVEIDRLVYGLYVLTEEESGVVEGKS